MEEFMSAVTNLKRGDGEFDRLVQDDRVHRSVYVDPEIFAREMDNIFAGTWVYLLHESELRNPGDYRQAWIGTREVFVTRDEDGQINVLSNRCSHRGAVICREFQGNASTFTCPYHGWRYDARGQLFGIPGKNAYGPTFKSRGMNLARPAKVASYKGLVFATLNPNAIPIVEHLGNAAGFIDAWLDHQGGPENIIVSGAQRFKVNCNWKMVYDNAGDGYHVPFSHQSLLVMTSQRYGGGDMSYFGDADKSKMPLHSLDNGHTIVDQRPEMFAENAWDQQRPQPGREPFEEYVAKTVDPDRSKAVLESAVGAGMNLCIFPNLLFIGNQIQVLQPVRVDQMFVHFHATRRRDGDEHLNAIRLRTQEDFPILGEMDDADNFEECQRGLMGSPEDEWVDISRHFETGKDVFGDDRLVTAPVTSELHMRNYYAQWKRLMKAQPTLRVTKEKEAR
jgi:phenylpropionate dioxygenase-like ring-hydroxylating dioxygenase large terminal subunit